MSDVTEIDPDVVEAIELLSPIVLTLNQLSRRLAKEPKGSRYAASYSSQIGEINRRIGSIAARIPIAADTLLRMINDALDNKARRGRDAPTRPSSRTLLRSLTEAQQALDLMDAEDRERALRRAELIRAVEAATEACRAWGAAPLVVTQ